MNTSQVISVLLLPSRRQLVVFGLILTPIITYVLWHASFIVSALFIYLYEMLIGAGIVVWLGLFLVDKAISARLMLSSHLRSYAVAGLITFIAVLLLELPVHWILQRLSDRDGDLIRARVEAYRAQNDDYPTDLSDGAFGDLPKRSWTGSLYTYNRELRPYTVRYASIGGRERFYSHQYKSWSYPFDE
jgi:hypothetical protein